MSSISPHASRRTLQVASRVKRVLLESSAVVVEEQHWHRELKLGLSGSQDFTSFRSSLYQSAVLIHDLQQQTEAADGCLQAHQPLHYAMKYLLPYLKTNAHRN